LDSFGSHIQLISSIKSRTVGIFLHKKKICQEKIGLRDLMNT
jgi:hypothetical protein